MTNYEIPLMKMLTIFSQTVSLKGKEKERERERERERESKWGKSSF